MKSCTVSISASLVTVALVGVLSAVAPCAATGEETSFDGLNRVESSRIAIAYLAPDADFSVFARVKVLEPLVAFRSSWQRDQNRNRTRNISTRDMERIKADVASLFQEVFAQRLTSGGYEVTNEVADDVLIVRPAIIDLDITAPETRSGSAQRSFTATAGAATIYVELFDAATGQIIGRGADRQASQRTSGFMTWSGRVTNSVEARRILQGWADVLVKFLDGQYAR
jgi:hypothetical protein